jgi:hypothetical protein
VIRVASELHEYWILCVVYCLSSDVFPDSASNQLKVSSDNLVSL